MKHNQTLRRGLGILLSLVLCLSLLPATALAEGTATTDQTADFTDSDNISTALTLLTNGDMSKAEWNSDTSTLTLKGVNFTTTNPTAVKLPDGAKIVLAEGTTNTIASVSEGAGICFGIDDKGALEIKGSGTLTVTSGAAGQFNAGINAYGDVTISGSAKVIATGGASVEMFSYGISTTGNMTISDSAEVTATGGQAYSDSCGIDAYGDVTISDTAEVTATGGTGSNSYGISAGGTITISGSNVIARTLAGTGGCKAALSKAPTLQGYNNNNYYWRTGDTAAFTLSTVKAYEYNASDTYVEFSNGGNITADFTADDTSPALALLTANGGTATWKNNTLTLNGVSFTTSAAFAVKLPKGATIVLAEGTTNTITSVSEGAGSCFGIYDNGDLEIKGGGTLTVTAAGAAGDNSAGIYAGGGVTISDAAEVTATGSQANSSSIGIWALGNVTISGSAEVIATGGGVTGENAKSYGINATNGAIITISGGHVTAKTLAGESATTRMALNQAPVLSDYNNYYWRTSSNGSFITDKPYESSDTSYTYVEFCDGSTYVEYGVTVNGVKVTNLNKNDVLGDGVVRYAPDADTVYAGGSLSTLTIAGTGSTDVVLNGYFPYLEVTGARNVTGTEVQITVQAQITCTGDVTINNEHSVVGELIVSGAQDVTVTSSYSSYINPPAIISGYITCYGDVTISNTGGGEAVQGTLTYQNAGGDHSYTVKTGDSLENLTDSVTMDAGETFTGVLNASAVKISVTHTAGEWQNNSTQHWQVCTLCGAEFNRADHTFSGSTCTVCGYTKPSGGGSGSGSSGGSAVTPDEPEITPTEPEITTDGGTTVAGIGTEVTTSGTTSTATVSQDTLEKAVEAAESAAGQTDTTAAVEIAVETPAQATEVKVDLPAEGLESFADSEAQSLTISSGVGTVTISPEAAASIAAQAQGETVTVTISAVAQPEEVLNDRQLAAVGDAPVYDLSVTSSGTYISQFGGGLVTVSLPYSLKAGEDPSGVVVYYVDDLGNIQRVRAMYDVKTQSILFTTNHFSLYMVRYEATAAAAARFTDVPFDAYYQNAVGWAVNQGITTGTTTTTFSPDASCTRAQMVTFLWRAAGSPKVSGSNPFSDVSADAYYYDAVLWAVKNGITSGTSATTFSPDATCTRAQTVTFLYRAAGSPAASGSSFSDVSSDAYYADAVAWAVQQNITTGTGNGKFSPNADCTRAQIVTFLYRAMGE